MGPRDQVRGLRVPEVLSRMAKLSQVNRNAMRCEITGRSRGNYRKFKLSRIALRDLASAGQIPGMVKASW